MKKKLITLILALVCAFCCAFGFTACGNNGDNGGGACEHNFVQKTYHQPTCTEGSYYDEECSKCGETRKGRELQPASGHGSGNAQYNNDETCTENGTESWECPMCHETVSREVPNSARHIFNGTRDCERCDAQVENKYLKYELNDAGDGYIVDCSGSDTDWDKREEMLEDLKIVNIPSRHDGLPVVGIKKGGSRDSTTVAYVPATVKEIGENAFAYTPLINIIFEESSELQSIGARAFESTRITELTLPEGITSLASYTLYHMPFLTCITIPKTLTEIGHNCFNSCNRLNTIINHSDLPMENDNLKVYFGVSSLSEVNSHLAVRDSNPNYLVSKVHTYKSEYDSKQAVSETIYFSYVRLDGENILTGFFGDNESNSATRSIEVPYGITQVDSTALHEVSWKFRSGKELILPKSVKMVIKTEGYTMNNIYIDKWSKVSISEYTEIVNFNEDDFSFIMGNGSDAVKQNRLEIYKDETSEFVFDFNFHDLWNTVAENNYVYEKNGIKLTFTRSNETSLNGEGEVIEKTEDHLDSVFFGDTDILITMELVNGVKLKIDTIMLEGHTTGPSAAAVTLRATYFDSETDMYVSGKSDERSFTTQYNEFSFNGFNSGDYKTAEKWRFALWETNHQGDDKYSYNLRSLRITFDKKFNADLTEKAFA